MVAHAELKDDSSERTYVDVVVREFRLSKHVAEAKVCSVWHESNLPGN